MRGCRRLTWGAWNDCDAGNRRPACGLRPGRSRARRHAVAAQRPDRLGDRPERGRQDHLAGRRDGAAAGARRAAARRPGPARARPANARRARPVPGARAARTVRRAERAGQPATGRLRAPPAPRSLRPPPAIGVLALSAPGRAPDAARRHALGRRAANARAGPGADVRAAPADARRAQPGPGAADRARDTGHRAPVARRRRIDPAGRAKRGRGGGKLGPRLRAGDRRNRAGRPLPGAGPRPARAGHLPGRQRRRCAPAGRRRAAAAKAHINTDKEQALNIVCIGGGPAGLYFGLLMKQQDPAHRVTVVERNKPYDTFGWGVVFSDATMDNMRRHDRPTADAIEQAFNHWDDIALEFKGQHMRCGGHGFVGIGRKRLLNILQARCEELGVQLVFETEANSDTDYPDADLIIASDGIHSSLRAKYRQQFQPDIVLRPNRYLWLGTHKRYSAFTFVFEKTAHGWFQAHIYQFDADTSTFIVECPESVWLAHGLDQADQAQSVAFCEQLFARHLQGATLMTNARHLRGSAWLNFQRVVCGQWWLQNECGSHLVLMGDAVHTAHFAIGSGTKLAIEDAIELASQFQQQRQRPEPISELLTRYQQARRIETLRLQNAAWNAMEWFEACGQRYCDQLEGPQFMYSMLTRSQRISHENLR